MLFIIPPRGRGYVLHPLRGRITAYFLTPLLLFLLVSPVAGRTATLPTWSLAPGQSPDGVVLAVPGIAPMQSETSPATISVGIPIDIAGDGRPEVFFCHGTHYEFPPKEQPCRFIELGDDGSVEDRSFALLGPELPGMNGPREITVADFNDDGQPDIFVANQGIDGDPFPGERNVLLVSRPDGTYENRSAWLPDVPDFTHSSTAADLEGDGDIDIMVGNLGLVVDPAKTYLLINDGDGNFVQDTSRLPATLADRDEFYTDFLLVDANGDGFPDLFMGTWMPCCPSAILLNDGSGSFANLPRIELPPGPLGAGNENVQDAVAMMLNDDSFPDLVVLTTIQPDYVGTGVQALVSNGDGTFRDESAARFGANAARFTGDYYGNLRLADLNADGAMDFHFGNGLDTEGRYWINDGFGNFTLLPANYLGLPHGFGAHSVDFDGDGRPDQLQLGNAAEGKLYYRSFLNTTPVSAADLALTQLAAPSGSVAQGATVSVDADVTNVGGYLSDPFAIRYLASLDNVLSAADTLLGRETRGALPAGQSSGGPFNVTIPAILAPGTYFIGAVIDSNDGNSANNRKLANQSLTVTANAAFQINAGHSGAWFNPETSGQGQLIDIEPESQFMFLAWFTYTDDGSGNPNQQHWLTAQGNYSGDGAVLTVYETLGGKFDDPQAAGSTVVGSLQLSFDDCANGSANYTIEAWGVDGSFPLTRVIPGSENVCQGLANANRSGLVENDGWDGAWYDPEAPGQGFLIDVHPNPDADDFIFVAWFTYGDTNASGQRWLTAQGPMNGMLAELAVYESTGGSFDDTKAVSSEQIGTMTIEFNNCNSATLTYELTDESLSGSIDIIRVVPGTEALCEELASVN